MTGGIVKDHCLVAVIAGGGILDAGWTGLSEDGGLPALGAGSGDQGGFSQIIAAEFLVHFVQHRIVFQKAQRRGFQADHGLADIERIAEIAGVADVVAGGDGRGVDRGDGGIERMAVGEINALLLQPRHVGHVARLDAAIAQAIGDKDDDVVRRR